MLLYARLQQSTAESDRAFAGLRTDCYAKLMERRTLPLSPIVCFYRSSATMLKRTLDGFDGLYDLQAPRSYIQLILTSISFTVFFSYMSECHSADRKKQADNGASVIETAEKGEEQTSMQIKECASFSPPLALSVPGALLAYYSNTPPYKSQRGPIFRRRFTDDDLILLLVVVYLVGGSGGSLTF